MHEVLLYSMLELGLQVGSHADNRYDPAEIEVDVRVTDPGGQQADWPAYWDGTQWAWRYRPLTTGTHQAQVLENGAAGRSFEFEALRSAAAGPIHADGWGFRHADGSPFIPLGLNLGWSDGGGTEDYARWFAALSAAGGNFARFWFTHFTDQDPEWDELGVMDQQDCAELDAIFDLAQENGIALMPVLWQHSELEAAMWSSWEDNPYNAANGGPCESSSCFFEDQTALGYQRLLLRYAVARWGAHPALAAWEVINEADGISGVDSDLVAAWASDRADEIRALEGDLHPVSWSYSLPPQALKDQVWSGADFVQVHSYLLADAEPVAEGVAASLQQHGGPVLVGEWGLDWLGNGDREDSQGLAWHNASWAALASGSAGNALTWWWQDHVEPDDLWWRLQGAARVVPGLDLPAMAPLEVQAEGPVQLQALARGDAHSALVWVHDPDATPPEADIDEIVGASVWLPDFPQAQAWVYDTSSGEVLDHLLLQDEPLQLPPFSGDVALVIYAMGSLRDEGCGCAAGRRAAAGWGLLLLLGSVGLRRARRRILW